MQKTFLYKKRVSEDTAKNFSLVDKIFSSKHSSNKLLTPLIVCYCAVASLWGRKSLQGREGCSNLMQEISEYASPSSMQQVEAKKEDIHEFSFIRNQFIRNLVLDALKSKKLLKLQGRS